MSWKLILGLSMFGLAMAIGTVYVISGRLGGPLWLAIFVICAVAIARRAPGRFFLHGFLVGLTNWMWVAGAHVMLIDTYRARHPIESIAMPTLPSLLAPVVRLMRRFELPIPGASGLIIGLLSWIASKIPARRKASRAPSRVDA
jgi:hypothetical protein